MSAGLQSVQPLGSTPQINLPLTFPDYDIPDEVSMVIFRSMTRQDLGQALLVSKNWYALGYEASLNYVSAFGAKQIPDEITFRIFGNLSPEDLAQLSRINKKWKVLCGDDSLWNAFDLGMMFPSIVCVRPSMQLPYPNFNRATIKSLKSKSNGITAEQEMINSNESTLLPSLAFVMEGVLTAWSTREQLYQPQFTPCHLPYGRGDSTVICCVRKF